MTNYWLECIEESFEEAGIKATKDQIEIVASNVKASHENYSLFTGAECIPNPLECEVQSLKLKCKKLENDVETERLNFRKNVARRRGCRVEDVEIEDNGYATFRY